MSQVRDQVHTLQLSQLTYAQVKEIADRMFLDASNRNEFKEVEALWESWKTINMPTYGQAIAQTSVVTRMQGTVSGAALKLYEPSGSEIYEIQAIVLSANSTGPAQVDVWIEDVNTGDQLYFAPNVSVAANGFTNAFNLADSPFTIDSNQTLQWRVDSPSDASGIRIVGYHFLRQR